MCMDVDGYGYECSMCVCMLYNKCITQSLITKFHRSRSHVRLLQRNQNDHVQGKGILMWMLHSPTVELLILPYQRPRLGMRLRWRSLLVCSVVIPVEMLPLLNSSSRLACDSGVWLPGSGSSLINGTSLSNLLSSG